MRIPGRYAGAPGTGHGGVMAGRLAAYVGAVAVEVVAHRPARLDIDLRVEASNGSARLYDGTLLVAEATPTTLELGTVAPVDLLPAMVLPGAEHPYPGCFGCGAGRVDGLGLRPVRVADGRVVAPWTPPSADAVAVWAALDCIGAWATAAGRPVRLERMSLTAPGLIHPGEVHAVVGWLHPGPRLDDRPDEDPDEEQLRTGMALLGPDGSVLAVARSTWSLQA